MWGIWLTIGLPWLAVAVFAIWRYKSIEMLSLQYYNKFIKSCIYRCVMYSVLRILFIIYFVISSIASAIAFFFIDKSSSQKIKNFFIINNLIALGLLFLIMEINS